MNNNQDDFDRGMPEFNRPKQDSKVYKRNGMPEFYELLNSCADIHDRKSHDYASNDNPSGNYHFAGEVASLFSDPKDAGFAGRVAEKLYRLANLGRKGTAPLNESIEDTETDIVTITALWMADRRRCRAQSARQAEAEQNIIEHRASALSMTRDRIFPGDIKVTKVKSEDRLNLDETYPGCGQRG